METEYFLRFDIDVIGAQTKQWISGTDYVANRKMYMNLIVTVQNHIVITKVTSLYLAFT
jgi:hypothetical protein